jgi:type II secretory pathway component PulK
MSRRAAQHRCGVALVSALVALVIVVALVSTMLLAAVQSRRQLRRERDLRQCELLLRSGLDRAARRLVKDEAYEGETWALSADPNDGLREGRVAIRVERNRADDPPLVTVIAEYPLGDETSIRRSFTGTIQTQPQEN